MVTLPCFTLFVILLECRLYFLCFIVFSPFPFGFSLSLLILSQRRQAEEAFLDTGIDCFDVTPILV